MESAYFLPVKKGRTFPEELKFTSEQRRKKILDYTSGTYVVLGVFVPTLGEINKELDVYIRTGRDITFEELESIFTSGIKKGLLGTANNLMRVGAEMVTASVLSIFSRRSVLSAVYLWNITPHLNRYYGEVLMKHLRLPKFLAAIFGGRPGTNEIEFINSEPDCLAVLEDSFKRHALFAVGDAVVNIAKAGYLMVQGKKVSLQFAVEQGVGFACFLSCACIGSLLGHAAGGNTGEYCGGILGCQAAPTTTLLLIRLLRRKKSGRDRHHRHRSAPPKM